MDDLGDLKNVIYNSKCCRIPFYARDGRGEIVVAPPIKSVILLIQRAIKSSDLMELPEDEEGRLEMQPLEEDSDAIKLAHAREIMKRACLIQEAFASSSENSAFLKTLEQRKAERFLGGLRDALRTLEAIDEHWLAEAEKD